jgi:hypothetical protein
MNSKKMIFSLVPWVAFTLVVNKGGSGAVGFAALGAALLALVFTLRGRGHESVKVIDAAGIATFSVIAALAFTGSSSFKDDLANYGRGGSALVLAVVMLGSLLFVPFTEQYARESVPQEYWGSPVFRAVNRKISAIWGLAILAMSGSHLIAGYIEATGTLARRENLLLNWVIPILLVLGAIKFTDAATSERSDTAPAADLQR